MHWMTKFHNYWQLTFRISNTTKKDILSSPVANGPSVTVADSLHRAENFGGSKKLHHRYCPCENVWRRKSTAVSYRSYSRWHERSTINSFERGKTDVIFFIVTSKVREALFNLHNYENTHVTDQDRHKYPRNSTNSQIRQHIGSCRRSSGYGSKHLRKFITRRSRRR